MPIKSKGDGGGGTVDLSAIQQQIDSLDPSRPLGSFDPATFSDGPLPAADRNDYLWASAAGTITLNGTDHEVTKGDWVRCDVDGTAANTPANWSFVDRIGTTRLSRFQCYRDTSKTFAGDGTTNTGAGSVSGSDGGVITIPAAGTYTVTHTGTNVTGGAGAGFGINSTPFANPQAANDVVTGDIFTSSLDRINSTTPSKSYSVAFPSAGDYHLAFFSGGSNTTGSHELVVAGIGSDSGETVSVFTSEDGTQYAFADSDNREIDISGGIPASWMKCSDQQAITQVFDGATIDAAPPWEGLVSIGDQATKVIPTGVDLSQVDEVRVTFGRTNQTWGKITVPFDPSEIDFGKLQGTLLPHFGDTYLSIANMTAAQFEAGNIPFRTVTGQATFGFEISRIQFKKRVSVQSPIIEVQNTGTIITTGTFQNLGDPNPLFTGEDFARLHIEYGDGTRDQFTFLDGLVKEERKGFENYEIEARVVNGQIQIRDLGTQSGISKAWYAHPAGATRIPAATGEVFIEVASQFVTVEEDFAFSGTDYLPVPLTSAVDSPILGFDVQAGKRYKFKFGLRMLRANATADLRLQVTGPAGSTGMTAYQSIENAISQAVTFGDPSIAIAVAAVTVDAHADLHYAEGWLVAGADGRVELSIRNNAGTSQQTLGALSFVESKEV